MSEPVFWTCDDAAEQLEHEDLEEAVVADFEQATETGAALVQLIADRSPLQVFGYSRSEVTDRELEGLAESAVDTMAEILDENELGDPNGVCEVLKKDARERLEGRVLELLKAERADGGIVPWSCEVTKTVELTAEQVERILRAWEPEWFEEGER